MTDADLCRSNNWTVGTRLHGANRHNAVTIELTAIGEVNILAKKVLENGEPVEVEYEHQWRLASREWVEVG